MSPNALGQLDCNGFSPIQTELRSTYGQVTPSSIGAFTSAIVRNPGCAGSS